MSSDTTGSTGTATALSLPNKIGLGLAAVLGLLDFVSGLLGAFAGAGPAPGEVGPPFAVLVAASVLGLVTVVAVVYTWRSRSQVGARIVAGSRILAALTALPAFFVADVPPALVAIAATFIVLTIVTVGLVLARRAPQQRIA